MNKDTVEIIGSWEELNDINLLKIQIKLNGQVVDWLKNFQEEY